MTLDISSYEKQRDERIETLRSEMARFGYDDDAKVTLASLFNTLRKAMDWVSNGYCLRLLKLETALKEIETLSAPPGLIGCKGPANVAEKYMWLVDQMRDRASKALVNK